jgi:hypothetical protein
MSDDPNREMRTMVLLSQAYPPLPLMVTRTEDGRLLDEEVTTTHSLIAQGLDDCMARNDPVFNEQRRKRQKAIFQEFLRVMAADGFTGTDEVLYRIYCKFSLDQIATYFPPGHPVDARFQPLSYVVRHDKCHTKLAEYMAAQSILFEDKPPVPREIYLGMEFPAMLRACRDRLGHLMTPEERARLDDSETHDEEP